MKNPVRRIADRLLAVAVIAAAVLCAPGLGADPPAKPGEGFGVFLVVFRQMHESSDQGQGRLNVAKFGGVEHEKRDGVLVVTLPLKSWADVEAHPDVAYVQRVWMGEPLDDWTAGRVRKDRPRTSTNATLEAEVPAAVWDSADYAYDGSGNVTGIGNDQYAYDSAGRIIQSTVGGVAETYGYDSFGNLVAKTTGTRAAPIPPVDPGSNRFTGYRYDAAGNVLSLPGSGATLAERASTYEYDSLGMPTTVTGHAGGYPRRMIYTADDERIGSIEQGAGSSAKIWLRGFDGKVLREYRGKLTSSNWIWIQDYVYASGQLLAAERESSNGGRLHFHLDHLGSTRLITKADKTELSAHRFFPFGVEQSDSAYEAKNFDLEPNRIEPMKFTGHERDFYGPLNVDGTDHLDYMHARFYDAGVGRFLSVDPVLGNLMEPQSWNRYAYVLNNPLNFIDPNGLRRVGAGATGNVTCDEMGCWISITVTAEDPLRELLEWLKQRWNAFDAARASQIEVLRREAGNAKYLSWNDAPILRASRDVPCKSYGERFLQSAIDANMLPGVAAPTGLGLLTGGATANAVRGGITPLQWARAGFGGATLRGVSFTAAETALITGATAATNFLLVSAAYETGVVVGSAVNAALTDGCE